jgi:hypothetical protein
MAIVEMPPPIAAAVTFGTGFMLLPLHFHAFPVHIDEPAVPPESKAIATSRAGITLGSAGHEVVDQTRFIGVAHRGQRQRLNYAICCYSGSLLQKLARHRAALIDGAIEDAERHGRWQRLAAAWPPEVPVIELCCLGLSQRDDVRPARLVVAVQIEVNRACETDRNAVFGDTAWIVGVVDKTTLMAQNDGKRTRE